MSETTTTKSREGIGGPKTPEGKARVKLNALTTGLYAKAQEAQKVVAESIGVTFDEIHQQMIDYYQPKDPVEETLVRRIARCSWRFMIYERMEDFQFMNKRSASRIGDHLERLSIMERRTDVQLHRAIQALAAKRRENRESPRENSKNKLPDLHLQTPRSNLQMPSDPDRSRRTQKHTNRLDKDSVCNYITYGERGGSGKLPRPAFCSPSSGRSVGESTPVRSSEMTA